MLRKLKGCLQLDLQSRDDMRNIRKATWLEYSSEFSQKVLVSYSSGVRIQCKSPTMEITEIDNLGFYKRGAGRQTRSAESERLRCLSTKC